MSTETADVLVIGGGPAGSTAAFQLASAGLGVMLIDRASFPRDKTCGESLSPGALARLASIGMWRPGEGSSPSVPIRGMRIRSPRGTTFLGRYRSGPSGAGLAIPRMVLDAELLASARARGVRVMEGIEAVAGDPNAQGRGVVTARSTHGTGQIRIEAGKVIVADGRQSLLARQLGFLDAPRERPGRRRYAVRAHCEGVSDLSDLAEMHVGERGYCGIAPLSPTLANICYVVFTDTIDMTPRTIETDFRRHLRGFPEVARRVETARIVGRVRVVGPLRLTSPRQCHGPFIACGDATGFLDPFTGEGIAHAVASGFLGAEAIKAALTGTTDSFRDYERKIRALRRVKGMAARLLYGLVARPALANSAATVFARLPRLGDAIVQLFGDQV